MDREWGSKPGSGGAASAQNEAIDRRERLRRLALETIDLAKDPYFMRNHLGSYECKLCLTLHNNEGNYLAHTQGKRHQTNLAKRAAREAKDAPAQPQPHKRKVTLRKTVKIGRPGYRVTKQYDPETKQRSLLFQIEYPEIEDLMKPRHRFMSSYEQRVQPFDKRYQYLLFAAEPYEIVAFKVFSYFWTFFALCFCLCFCSLLYIFRCPARRLTSPLQISSRTGILTPRCSRLLHLLLFLVCHGKLDLSKCLRVICILYKHLNGLAACLINVCGEEIMIIQFSEEALSSSF
ncbi:Splicing factor 3A subunit 2 isoform B [Glycine soja]|uniref:Splicing factor 3A subunit 2 isoform B n=1 Tax=Glycine soja TaxID=3848 RepID=A0A445GM34_GLYSO|nr:Splicing factor 3A subunit 2 isoform B [Glycine soja]